MKSLIIAAAVVALFPVMASQADAQVIAYHAAYAPEPVVVAPVVPVYRGRVAYRPVVAAAPVVTQVSPVATVIAPPSLQPVVTTRWRPILGGTVSRVRYRYAPPIVYGY